MNKSVPPRAGNLRRRLDFLIGVPIVFLLGCFRRIFAGQRKIPATLQEIGLLQIAAIGDTVLMSAVWNDLRRQFPSARIRVLVGESNHEISRLLFGDENILLLPVKQPLASLRMTRQFHFDALIDFGPWPRWNAILAAAIPARYRIGYNTRGQYRHYAYDLAVLHSARAHELENQRALMRPLGVTGVHLPAISITENQDAVSPSKTPYMVFHPWAGGYKNHLREWPAEKWVELALKSAQAGYEVHLSGSPAEKEKTALLVADMVKTGARARSLAGALPLVDLVAHLSRAAAVISVNTGIMHIAAATGSLTLGLHGPTDVKRWGPVGTRVLAIESPCPGCGFLDLGFEYPREVPPCMNAITVDAVWQLLFPELSKRYSIHST